MADVGCDVSKDWVDLGCNEQVQRCPRAKDDLERYFAELPADSHVLVEPTGRYHRLVVQCARRAGHEVKVVDPYAFSLYRRSVKPRASNDRISALVLARFARKEWEEIPEYRELPKHLQRLKDLLELRETQVTLRVAWQQSMSEIGKVPASVQVALAKMEQSIRDLDLEIFTIVKADPLYEEFLKMDGVGRVTAAALVWLFRAFRFVDPDQVVAFAGLDVRVRESGKFVGQRKLTKRGPALLRRLLSCGANALRTIEHFRPLFEKHHARGRRVAAVNVILARRMLRCAFAIACHGARYDRAKFFAP